MRGVPGGDGTHNQLSGSVGRDSIQVGQARDITLGHREVPEDEACAGTLADVVGERSRKELEQWRIGDPEPLRVRWHAAKDVASPDAQRDGELGDPVPLSGQFTAIRETFQATGSQRLVVLGRAGAGKTVLAHRLILDLLAYRGRRGPVPVLFSLSDWDPTAVGLRDWMVERLVRDDAFLEERDATGKRHAEVLVHRDWILPVLDGFDEIPSQHHEDAIDQISQVQLPLLLTSRPDEYARAARAAKPLGRAATVEIEDLTLDQAQRYLCRSAGASRAAEWAAVFEQLHAAPEQTASRNLICVLTTPLMVMIARTHYEKAEAPSPGELLDTVRFPAETDLKRHLFTRYVDTVYDSRRTQQQTGVARPVWNVEQARHWLGYLAIRLQARDTLDFMWWQLPTLLPCHTRILATTTVSGLAYGLAFVLASRVAGGLASGLTVGLASGLTVGLAIGLVNEARFGGRRTGREPERLRPYPRRRGRQRRLLTRASLTKVASEFTNGLAIGFTLGLAGGLWSGPKAGLTLGIALGGVIGVVNVVVSVLGEGLDPHDSDP